LSIVLTICAVIYSVDYVCRYL